MKPPNRPYWFYRANSWPVKIVMLFSSALVCAIGGYSATKSGEFLDPNLLFFVLFGGVIGGAILGGSPCSTEKYKPQKKDKYIILFCLIASGSIGFITGLPDFSLKLVTSIIAWSFLGGIFGFIIPPYFFSDSNWKSRIISACKGAFILSGVLFFIFICWYFIIFFLEKIVPWTGGIIFSLVAALIGLIIPGSLLIVGFKLSFPFPPRGKKGPGKAQEKGPGKGDIVDYF